MDRALQKEHLGAWLSQLNEREQKILKLRFGLEGAEPLTLAEIASHDQCLAARRVRAAPKPRRSWELAAA